MGLLSLSSFSSSSSSSCTWCTYTSPPPHLHLLSLSSSISSSYTRCIFTKEQKKKQNGPWSVTLEEEGVYLYTCGVKTHCSRYNQKARITVSQDCGQE